MSFYIICYYFSILKLKAPDVAGILIPGPVADMPKMVQLEDSVVVQPVLLKVPVCQPGIMHKELVCRLQHQVCLILGEESSSWPACVKDDTEGIIGSNPLLIPQGTCRILMTELPENIQQVQALSSFASEAGVLVLSDFFVLLCLCIVFFDGKPHHGRTWTRWACSACAWTSGPHIYFCFFVFDGIGLLGLIL